jgi:hypothetical protein
MSPKIPENYTQVGHRAASVQGYEEMLVTRPRVATRISDVCARDFPHGAVLLGSFSDVPRRLTRGFAAGTLFPEVVFSARRMTSRSAFDKRRRQCLPPIVSRNWRQWIQVFSLSSNVDRNSPNFCAVRPMLRTEERSLLKGDTTERGEWEPDVSERITNRTGYVVAHISSQTHVQNVPLQKRSMQRFAILALLSHKRLK